MSEAERMLLEDAIEIAIEKERENIILKRILCVSTLIIFGLLVLCAAM